MRLYGKRSCLERLKANPRDVKKIYLQEGVPRSGIEDAARANHIPVERVKRHRFDQLAGGVQAAQGIMAEVSGFQYRDFDDIILGDEKPTLICLDRINDPQNLGVIIRSSACFGKFCIVLPKHESVSVNETVLKVACGAENYTPVTLVTNLSLALQKASKAGYWIGATVVEGGEHPRRARLNFPLALVFGSEGSGIRPGLLKRIDYKLTLPMRGAGLSFNVGIAVSVFCYEIACHLQEEAGHAAAR